MITHVNINDNSKTQVMPKVLYGEVTSSATTISVTISNLVTSYEPKIGDHLVLLFKYTYTFGASTTLKINSGTARTISLNGFNFHGHAYNPASYKTYTIQKGSCIYFIYTSGGWVGTNQMNQIPFYYIEDKLNDTNDFYIDSSSSSSHTGSSGIAGLPSEGYCEGKLTCLGDSSISYPSLCLGIVGWCCNNGSAIMYYRSIQKYTTSGDIEIRVGIYNPTRSALGSTCSMDFYIGWLF